MPLVRFKTDEIDQTARMFTPKLLTRELAWLNEARKVLPRIPNPAKTDWRVLSTSISLHTVRFELANSVGKTATITIDRLIPGLG